MIRSVLARNSCSGISKLIPKNNSTSLCQQFSRLCVAKPVLLFNQENKSLTQQSRNFGFCYSSLIQSVANKQNVLENSNQPNSLLLRNIMPSILNINHTRNLTRISKTGKTWTVRMVTQRFRRLGNGLWLHRQPGYNRSLWRKALKPDGRTHILKAKGHVFCNKWQTKRLDKMVGKYWKKNKWYVDDPYEGYTDHSYHFYHPMELPWNTLEKPDDYYGYGYYRMKMYHKAVTKRKNRHKTVMRSHRQKHVPKSMSAHFCRG